MYFPKNSSCAIRLQNPNGKFQEIILFNEFSIVMQNLDFYLFPLSMPQKLDCEKIGREIDIPKHANWIKSKES